MLPDRVSNPGPLTYESGALPIALRGPAHPDKQGKLRLACSLGIGVIRVYTVVIPSVHCRRIAITG